MEDGFTGRLRVWYKGGLLRPCGTKEETPSRAWWSSSVRGFCFFPLQSVIRIGAQTLGKLAHSDQVSFRSRYFASDSGLILA